jgi:hypothetical protein
LPVAGLRTCRPMAGLMGGRELLQADAFTAERY